MPTLFYFMWCMLAGALILPALALGRWSDRWRVGGMLAVTFGLPFASETVGVNTYGFGTQGRYMLVTAVGVTMLAAYAIFREGMLNNTMLVRFTRLVVPIAAGLQVFFLVGSMERWQRGMNGYDFWMDPFTGVWHPRVGSVLPVVLGLLGAVALIVYGWKVSVEDGNAPSGKATLVEPARATL